MRRRKSRIRPVDDATSHILSSGDKQGLTQNVIDDYKGMLGTFEEKCSPVGKRGRKS